MIRMKPLLILVLSLSSAAASGYSRQWHQQTLTDILDPANYDARMRPSGANGTGPVIVYANMMVREIGSISDVEMEMDMTITLRMQWQDDRLRYHGASGKDYLTISDPTKIWIPDVFFKNDRRSNFHNVMTPNNYLRIFPDGAVLYSTRISLSLACPADLKMFPFGEHSCNLKLASYGYTTDNIVFLWKDEGPVQVTPNLHLAGLSMDKFITDYCNSRTNTGSYSCLRLDFSFIRESSNYISRFFIPSINLVVMSWLAFWLDPVTAATPRLLLALSSQLGMMFLAGYVDQLHAPVSYTTAMDVWMGVCVTFVFAALLEVVLVASVGGRKSQDSPDSLKEAPRAGLLRLLAGGNRVDALCRALYPLAFIVFNIAYWSSYAG